MSKFLQCPAIYPTARRGAELVLLFFLSFSFFSPSEFFFSLVYSCHFLLFFASGFPSLLGCFHRRLLWGCGDIQTGNLTSLILFCAKFGMHKIEEFGEFWSWNGWEDGFTCEWMQI